LTEGAVSSTIFVKMDVLLINPPWIKGKGNIWKGISACLPPPGLGYIAAVLEQRGVNVKVLDANAEGISSELKLNDRLKSMSNSPSFIGITATTSIIQNALDVAAQCKKVYPSSLIVFGGIHATVLPEDVLATDHVDYVIRGEGENSFWQLISEEDKDSILGLSYRQNGKFYHNLDAPIIKDLDSLPFPAYHLLPMKKYHPALGSYRRLPAINMVINRGCPGRCTFCYGQFLGQKLRTRSAESIVEEIKLLHKDYGIREISFYDDNFTTRKKEISKFCSLLINNNMDISWSCFSRVDFVNEDLLKLMKRAGCHQICYGIESGSEKILKNIKKRTSLKIAKETVALTKKIGIEARVTFMFGNPGETEESMQKTIDFSISLKPDMVVYNITTPYPGTEMYEWADKNNYLKTKDWPKYDLSEPIMDLPSVSSEMVKKYYGKAYRRFYLNPAFVIKRLVKRHTFNDMLMAARAIKSIFSV
jgi:radical SAM superfamily enzyme YgiQ (UPF0313 family)